MGFRINTNVAAMNSHMNSVNNNRGLDKSLASLSSGLRINNAADDASGLSIANQLKSQAQGLGQAIRNANDGINMAQTADGALEEYTNIINTVRTKAIQAASDGQSANSRKAIQNDIDKLLEEANNIAKTTSFNGMKLLDGNFTDKKFQIGAYADETVGMSISSAKIDSVGSFAEQEGGAVSTQSMTGGTVTINTVTIDDPTAGTGVGRTVDSAWSKANAINEKTSSTGVTAKAETNQTATTAVSNGSITAGSLTINGTDIGAVTFDDNDSSHTLIDAINKQSGKTHVTASLDDGVLKLKAEGGEDIVLGGGANTNTLLHLGDNSGTVTTHGKITLSSTDGPISITDTNNALNFGTTATITESENLGTVNVNTFDGAQKAIKIADAALKEIDKMRSGIGSVQNQLESTVRNISVTQVNVTASESTIRDVDFAQESANLQKHNILAQSGVYAMSQANSAQQNVMRLLQ